MRKYLTYIGTILTAVAGSLFAFAQKTFAISDQYVQETATQVGENISTQSNIVATAFTVINWVLSATFAFAVIMLIIGGFRYITSAGNEGQAEAAKETITQAVIGLVIVLLAFVIASTINMVLSKA